MKILYTTFLELPFNSGIYDSQVKTLLFTLKKKYAQELDLHLSINIGFAYLGRRNSEIVFKKYRKDCECLIAECAKKGVRVKVNYLFLPLLKRHSFHLNSVLLPLMILISFPIYFVNVIRVKPDIIHCRSYPATLMAVFAKLIWKKAKIIFDMRGLYPEEGIAHGRWKEDSVAFKMWKCIEKILLKKSERIIVLSDPFKKYVGLLSNEYESKISYIAASIDKIFFEKNENNNKKIRSKLGLENKKVFVSHGSLNYWHSPRVLAEIFIEINKIMEKAFLMILTTYDKKKFANILKSCGIDDTKYYISFVPFIDIPKYLAAADYAIIPSADLEFEKRKCTKVILDTMIGLKVSECMGAGLPLIANENIGGLKYIMDSNNLGVTFGLGKKENYGEKIRYLENNYERISKRCKEYARDHLDVEVNAEKYFEIYKMLHK